MIRRVVALALVIGLLFAPAAPAAAQPATGLAVTSSTVQVDFPARIVFNLSARSAANITDIRLHYTVDRFSFAEVTSEVSVVFAPAREVKTGWTWDMRRTGGLPPGTVLHYWWTLRDAAGATLETQPARLQYDDLRYTWNEITRGNITLYWYRGDRAFASELMDAAQQGLDRLARDTGATLKEPSRIYIYGSQQDLLGAAIFPQEWAGGWTEARYRVIEIGIAPGDLAWGQRAMVHELAHLVVHQVTQNPYNDLPRWLDEGLAMYSEGQLQPLFEALLKQAVTGGSLLSVRSLSSPFSAVPELSYLSYAESYSLVKYLVTTYGQPKMLQLLNAFARGATYDGALQNVYGFDMDGLNTLWRDWVRAQYGLAKVTAFDIVPGPAFAVLAGLTTAVALLLALDMERGWQSAR